MDASAAPDNTQKPKKERTISQYEDTAYNSQAFPPQKPRPERGFIHKVITKGKLFNFFHSNDTLCIPAINDIHPSTMAQYEADDDGEGFFWNEKTLTHHSYSFWGRVYEFMAGLAMVSLKFILPIFYSLFVIGLLFGSTGIVDRWHNGDSDIFWGLTLIFTLPSLLLYGHYRLVMAGRDYLAPFLKIQRVFQLNRTNGMVTLYKKDQPYFTRPFLEFDCVLMSAPSHQGFLSYSMVLIHRYHPSPISVPLGAVRLGPNEMVIEYLRFWSMIQRYMDISQPLPDIMFLEGVRQYDPTTIVYDKAHNRPPRYWRDMTYDEFIEKLNEIHRKNQVTDCVDKVIDIFKGPNRNTSARKKPTNKKKK